MTAATILTLANGKSIDLTDPKVEDIDFCVIAEHLAKEKRYNGATPRVQYAVAQHCVIGADAAFADTNDAELAAYVLLHDGAEAFLKDDTTPKKRALAAVAEASFGMLASDIMAAFDMLTDRFDAAIHAAAGLAWPPTPAMKAAVKSYDLALFVTEWRDLMGGIPHPNWDEYRSITPLRGTIVPWGWKASRRAFEQACKLYLPVFRAPGYDIISCEPGPPILARRKSGIADSIERSGSR